MWKKERKKESKTDRQTQSESLNAKQRRQNVSKENKAHEDREKDWILDRKINMNQPERQLLSLYSRYKQQLPAIREVWGYLFLCVEKTGRTYMAVHFQMSGLISLCANQHTSHSSMSCFYYTTCSPPSYNVHLYFKKTPVTCLQQSVVLHINI